MLEMTKEELLGLPTPAMISSTIRVLPEFMRKTAESADVGDVVHCMICQYEIGEEIPDVSLIVKEVRVVG